METISVRKRFVWIDWMKVIGITLVVFGHFHTSWAKYVYVFHVPLFFLISGMLSKVETDNKVFWKKIWFNLIVPILIICNIKFLISSFLNYRGISRLVNDIVGLNYELFIGNIDCVLGTCWFVYTLIIMKILYQYTAKISLFLSVIFLGGAFVLQESEIVRDFDNSWFNVLLTYVFFSAGALLHKYTEVLHVKSFSYVDVAITLVCFISILLLGNYNGSIDISSFIYGNNMFAFVLGGFLGTIFIYEVSKLLMAFDTSWLRTISIGTIVILGFHGMAVSYLANRIVGGQNVMAILLSLIMVVCFVPVIFIAKRFSPYLIGIYKVKK